MNAKRKVALVTGGAVRIGRAIVEALAAEGLGVVIHCDRSVEAATALAAQIRRRKGAAWVVSGPLGSEAGCRAVMASARRLAGRVDVLVNNAAVFHKDRIDTITEAGLTAELATNLVAPILLTRFFVEQTRRGCVINLLDRRIESNDPECVPYLLSKKALAEFTRTAALALAPRIRVNGVAPGAVLPPPGKGAAYLHDAAGTIPLESRITPADVAQAVVILLRLETVTGQIVFIDGGQHLLGDGAGRAAHIFGGRRRSGRGSGRVPGAVLPGGRGR